MNETEKTDCDNQMYQQDLTKCCECKKPFEKNEEYWELFNKQDSKVAMNSCLLCWDKWLTSKKKWGQMSPVDLTKCHECKKPFSKGQEYHEVYRERIICMNVCLDCHKKYTDEKKVWQK
jgi:hypothetical protein